MVSEYKIGIYIEIIKKNNRQSKNPNKRWGFRLNSYEGGGDSEFCFNYLDTYYTDKMCSFCD